MKKILSFLFIAAASSTAFAQSSNQGQGQPAQVGRYQLIEGSLSTQPGSEKSTQPRLFRIDTATGVIEFCDLAYADGGKQNGVDTVVATGVCAPFSGAYSMQKIQKKK